MRTARGWTPAVFSLLAGVLLLGVTPAFAGDVVLYGPGAPSVEQSTLAEMTYRVAADSEEAPQAGLSHILDLPFPSQEPVWMAGNLLVLPCADSSLVDLDPAEALAEGIVHVDDLDYEKALITISQALRALPCTQHPITRETLVDLHFFQGMAEFQMGNETKARRAFGAALAIDIDMAWKKAYPPSPQTVFLDAKSEALSRGTVPLGVAIADPSITSLSIDGKTLDPATPGQLVLYQGRHLVRYGTSDGRTVAALVDISHGGGTLVTRQTLRDAVLNLAWGGNGAVAARITLAELAGNRGAERVVVITLRTDGSHRAYSYDPATEAVLPLAIDSEALAELRDSKDSKKKKKGRKGPRRAERSTAASSAEAGESSSAAPASTESGKVTLVASGGLQISRQLPYALAALRVHGKLFRGLELGGGVQAGFRTLGPTTLILPTFHLDLRYRFEPGSFHFYLGGRGLLALSSSQSTRDDETVYALGGGAAVVGLDITPGGQKGFVINLDVAVGGTSRADDAGGQLYLTTGAGVGVRF